MIVGGHWWKDSYWEKLQTQLPVWIVERLGVWRPILLLIDKQLQALTKEIEAAAAPQRPKSFGALTCETLDREVGDWKRFQNRRQVASYTGMCPGQNSSGDRQRGLSITKYGNPRVRHALIELAWRVCMFQPKYPPVKKWLKVMSHSRATKAIRKKAIVAIGRHLAIDLWRLNVGRCTAKDLKLVLNN